MGQRLRELRDRADLSLRELANSSGISSPFLSEIERGRQSPSEEILGKLAAALNVPAEDLKRYGSRAPIADFKRRMNSEICLVTKVWYSGMAWFAVALADGLADSGIPVVFIAPAQMPAFREPSNPNVIRIAVPRELTGSASKYRSMASKFRRITSTLLAIGRQLLRSEKFLFSWPDHEIASIPTFLALRLLGKKVIFIVHDPVPHDLAHSKHNVIKRLLLRLLYRSASVLVVLSEAGRRSLMAEFRISPSKIHVIPHGAFGFADQSEIPGERILLAFGSIRRNKNLLMVIDAVKLVRASGLDVRLLVAGGYDRSSPYCLECLNAINSDSSAFINKTGFVDEAEIPELIKRTDAFVLAYSDFDSQSGVAVLAGVNGRPVIASLAGGIAELKSLGLVGVEIQQPVTAPTIARAILEFYGTPLDHWKAAAETGRSQLSYHLDWARIGRSYLRL